jgi:hypothetical protein
MGMGRRIRQNTIWERDDLVRIWIREHWGSINDLAGASFPNELNDDFRALKRALP